MEQHGCALISRKTLQGPSKVGCADGSVFGTRPLSSRRTRNPNNGPPRAAAHASAAVSDDAKEPGSEGGTFSQVSQLSPCIDSRILHHVLCLSPILEHGVGEAGRRSNEGLDQRLEGSLVSGTGAGHEVRIAKRLHPFVTLYRDRGRARVAGTSRKLGLIARGGEAGGRESRTRRLPANQAPQAHAQRSQERRAPWGRSTSMVTLERQTHAEPRIPPRGSVVREFVQELTRH